MLWAENNALCNRIKKTQKIKTQFSFVDLVPPVYYKKVSHKKLVQETKQKTVLGVTIANLQRNIAFEIKSVPQDDILCVFISKVEFTLGYPKQDVWIDNRYPSGSCEYNTILKHENQHVKYNNLAMKRYKKQFKLTVKQEYRNVPPLQIRNNADASRKIQFWLKNLQKIPYLVALEEDMNELLDLKHGHIDTDHNYKRTARLCDNW